jgi:hypothetical protein
MENKNRLKWTDMDWATYLGCSVQNVKQYRKVLKQNFLPCIEWDTEYKQYYFALYKREIKSSGDEKFVTLMTGGMNFDSRKDALKDAYDNIMPGITLEKNWARGRNIPVNAIQIMRVHMR